MDSNDDVPPLEDMEELVGRIKELSAGKNQLQPPSSKFTEPSEINTKSNAVPKPSEKPFGGMKKGFLFKERKKINDTTPAKESTKKVDYVVNASHNSSLVLDDVQQAMKQNYSNVLGNQEWLTEDLMKQLEGNKKLMRQLSDPRFSTAVEWMQKEPQKAMEYYKNDKDITEFFKEFCKILGGHFMGLADKQQNQPSSASETVTSQHFSNKEDEEAMNKIISDPEIREILSKPDIQNLFTLLRTEPNRAQAMLHSCSPRMRADIQKLVSAGLLGIEAR